MSKLPALMDRLRAGLEFKGMPAGALSARGPATSLWGGVREPFAGAWQQGVSVDPIGSLTSFGAVFACISKIASDIGKLDVQLLMADDKGIRTPAPATSPYWEALRRPNAYQNRIQFLIAWVISKLLYGNTYALKARDLRGIVYALYVLDPRRVTPMVTADGDVYYSLGGDDLSKVPTSMIVRASEVIHDRGVTLWHPLVGVSPIYACAMSATQGLRIQRNSAQFFENMSRPSGMLTAPGTIDEITAKRLKTEFESNYSAANIGRLAVLGDGLKYEPMGMAAVDAQLMEQLRWTGEDVARCFHMPLYKIGAGLVPSAGNVEALESQYYSGCLQILIESLELCLTEGLGLGGGATAGYEVQLDLEGLLRMDTPTQISMLAEAVKGTIMSPDEARAKRNLPPVPGGRYPLAQQQNYSLEALAKRDAQPDPFGIAKPTAPAPAPVPALPAPAPPPAAAAGKALDDANGRLEGLLTRIEAADERRRAEQADSTRAAMDALAALPEALAKAMPQPVTSPAAEHDDELAAMAKALAARFDDLELVD